MPAEHQSDDVGARTLYSIASFTKILLNVAFYRIISSGKYDSLGLSWGKSACDLFNELQRRKGTPFIRRFSRDPSILELLLHRNGFAPMNEHLLAPDGTFMMSKDAFLDAAPQITEDYFKGQKQGFTEYSNANHIFAGLLLEEITGLPLSEVMQEEVFNPLGMLRTAMDNTTLSRLEDEGCTVATGHRVSGDMKSAEPRTRRMYLTDTVEAAAFGAYSCTEDLARLVREFLRALDDQSDVFTADDTTYFFGPKSSDDDGGRVSLGGLYCSLDSEKPGTESTNKTLSPRNQYPSYRLGTLSRGRHCEIYYKAGTVDGFACAVYISLKFRCFVIALSNSSGPLDVTDHMARYTLQEALNLSPKVDIVAKVMEEGIRNAERVQGFEKMDSEDSLWSEDIQDFMGTYVHTKYGKTLEISRDRDLAFRWNSKFSSSMKAGRLGNKLRIFPGPDGFCIDRWSVWMDRDFTLHKRDEKAHIINSSGSDCYERISVQ